MNSEKLYQIKRRIDDYLEFNSDLIFRLNRNEVRIFGGAIRDSLAHMGIHDIDIISLPRAKPYISSLLLSSGYKKMDKITNKDFVDIYHGVQIISEPNTYMNHNFKIVQIITPKFIHFSNDVLIDLVQNVDISSCGLSYDGNVLYENFKNAYYHALNKVFVVNPNAKMYSYKRASERTHKLIKRGWLEIDDKMEIQITRDLNIDNILNSETRYLAKEYKLF